MDLIRKSLQLLLIFVLLAFFLLQVWESLNKFLTKQTTIALNRDSAASGVFPPLSFCPGFINGSSTEKVRKKFKTRLDENSGWTREDMESWFESITYDINEVLSSVSSDHHTGTPKYSYLGPEGHQLLREVEVEVSESWTDYGRCYTMYFLKELKNNRFYELAFNITNLPKGMVLYFHEEHSEVGLNYNNFPTEASAMKLTAGSETSAKISKVISKDRRAAFPCNESTNYSYPKCCRDWARNLIKGIPTACWCPQVKTLAEGLNLPTCLNSSHFDKARQDAVLEAFHGMNTQEVTNCAQRCLQPKFELERRDEPVPNHEETEKGMSYLFLFLAGTIETQEEYLLFDFNAIVAAVGGSLGLFLGISFFSLLNPLINVLPNKLRYFKNCPSNYYGIQ